ncbi:YciI family protein [Lysobacter sp. 5GHs7-4]|uniref:YciI family protein n=1 Tax=Lysobacter sp. 5GHs7-4 TaxID=2904253 RepID=UPI001E4A4866|nr:YciI family protein [Lysobacter sp. 5GHs7-4]UHQ25036.1 YciI family protein [Lysobacter sp. 5GHs7-4]
MKFLTIYTPDPNKPGEFGPQQQQRMGALIEEGFKNGSLLHTGGLLARGGARVTLDAGRITVTDGPYAEAKEVIAGYALIEVESTQAAIEQTRRFLEIAGDGTSEIHRIVDGDTPCA